MTLHRSLNGIFLLALALGGLAAPAHSGSAPPENPRPNIVVVMTDDQRWDHLGAAGHPFLKTPHLDRLAAEGAIFRNAFTTTSLCSPSRASFLSGLYAHTHRVLNNFTDFPANLPSYPAILKEAGYQTAYIGKWHMGEDRDDPRPGFDYWASHKGQGNYFDNEFNINGQNTPLPGYYTTAVTDLAVRYLETASKNDKPFCLIVGHKAPHTPYTPESRYEGRFDDLEINYPFSAYDLTGKPDWIVQRLDTWHGIYGPLYGFREKFPDRTAAAVLDFARFARAYAATVLSVDDSVGRLLASLQESGQLDQTIFVFTSDNGMFLGEHGMTDKRAMHDPSIRIPLLMRYPPRIQAGSILNEMVLNIDLAPTLLELCESPDQPRVHGRSIAPLLASEATRPEWRDAFLYEYNYEKEFPYTPNVRGIRTEKWKYIHYPHGDNTADRHAPELYNLELDPGERRNLAADPSHQDVLEQLQARLTELQRQTGGLPDRMPIDEGIQTRLPDEKIR